MKNDVLKRRGSLEPIERDLVEDILDPFDVIYISPCQEQVSNDPLILIQGSDDVPCNVTTYDCFENIPIDNETGVRPDPFRLDVEFDYELHFTIGTQFDRTVRALEGSMLQHIAAITGLENCPATSIARIGDRRLQPFSSPQQEFLLGVSSLPVDDKDPEFEECIVPVSSASVRGATCQPMLGSITAFLDIDSLPSTEDTLRNGILRIIRQGMIDDVYVTGGIRKASFIGKRPEPNVLQQQPTDPGPDTNIDSIVQTPRSQIRSRLPVVAISFIALSAVFLVALITIFIVRRRLQREELEFHDATVNGVEFAPEERNQPVSRDTSLAAFDTLALQPPESTASKSFRPTTTSSNSRSRTYDLPDKLSPAKPPRFDVSYDSDRVVGSPTSSLDGADESSIMSRLNGISEAGDYPLESDTSDEDDSVQLKRIL